jgi:hypothetical protein
VRLAQKHKHTKVAPFSQRTADLSGLEYSVNGSVFASNGGHNKILVTTVMIGFADRGTTLLLSYW